MARNINKFPILNNPNIWGTCLTLSQAKIVDPDMYQPSFDKGFIEHSLIIKTLHILLFHKDEQLSPDIP